MPGTGSFSSQKGGHTMHTHSLSINPDSGRTLRPWELALLLAVCVTLLTGTHTASSSASSHGRRVRPESGFMEREWVCIVCPPF